MAELEHNLFPRVTRQQKARPAAHAASLSLRLLAAPLLFFILLPVLAVLLRLSPAEMLASLQNRQVVSAINLSLLTSTITIIVTLLLGTPAAYLIQRSDSRAARVMDTIIDMPTVLPPAVAGVALLMAFGRQGLLGGALYGMGITLPFTTAAVVLAQTFIAAPLYVKSAALGFAAVSDELKKAAAMDGANRWQVFRYVVLPISWRAILTGCVLTWARALGEFGATMIFAGNFSGRTQTMPLAIYLGFEMDLNTALTLSALLMIVSFFVLLTVKALTRQHTPDTTDY